MNPIKVFVFSGGFGLPTLGPFALKLELWLKMAGIEYERVFENDTRKGPKGKNPWVEIDGEKMGDTELIIERLQREGPYVFGDRPSLVDASVFGQLAVLRSVPANAPLMTFVREDEVLRNYCDRILSQYFGADSSE